MPKQDYGIVFAKNRAVKKEDNILKTITVSMQEIWQQTNPKVHKSKKKYNRKDKRYKKDIS